MAALTLVLLGGPRALPPMGVSPVEQLPLVAPHIVLGRFEPIVHRYYFVPAARSRHRKVK